MTDAAVRPFVLEWDRTDFDRLRERIAAYRWPETLPGWDYGCDPEFLRRFCAYWTDEWDLDVAVADLNRYPQVVSDVGDRLPLHAVHVRDPRPGAIPLVMLHGWPGSHFEFWPALELLTEPDRDGPALDLVVPSLPGYGLSGAPAVPIGPRATAELIHELMTDRLGYTDYLVQGTDWGVMIAPWLATLFPDEVRALHLDNLATLPALDPNAEATEAVRDWRRRATERDTALGGYHRLQSTRPQSLAYAMADNPVAQAAWILERFHDWSDLGDAAVEDVYGLDRLVTSVMLYVMTGRFTTSTWMYTGAAAEDAATLPARVTTSVGYCAWPEPRSAQPDRSVVEALYHLTHWHVPERGGHFPPTEQPRAFVDDLVTWVESVG